MLVVHPSVPATTLQEYMALARAKPGELFYASSGVGGPNHLAGEMFNRMTGLQVTHVPFQVTGLALQAVVANQVGAMWGFTAGLLDRVLHLAGWEREWDRTRLQEVPPIPDPPPDRSTRT